MALLVRMPLARGVLTAKFKADIPREHRASLDGQKALNRLATVEALKPLAGKYSGGMTEMALGYALSRNEVTAIIPGARSISQLEENVRYSGEGGLPKEEISAINGIVLK